VFSMKNTIKLFGIAVIALAIVFSALSLTGCEEPSNNDNGDSTTPVSTDISLAEGVWANGSISEDGDGEQWFKFTATADTQYIHFNPGALTNVSIQLYDTSKETAVGGLTNYNASLSTSRTLTSGTAYFIKVTPYNSTDNGAYQIAFNTLITPPAIPAITLPTEQNTTALTANTWANGSISDGKYEQWFKFTATAATQYIHFNSGTLYDVYIQLYNATGTTVLDRTNLFSGTQTTSRTLTNGTAYFIKVTLSNNGDSGAYQIAFNTSTTAPAITLPTTSATINEGEWVDGSISSGGEQWFKFTATAATQYIHFNPGDLNDVYVQLYDNTGITSGARANLSASSTNTSRTLTNNNVYHIRVIPSGGSGAYKIAFNTTTIAPANKTTLPTDATSLTANTFANGNISTAGGEQWFKFTATAASQYIHFNPGTTLSSVYVQLYDNTGTPTGVMTNLTIYTTNTSRALTNNSEYYIKVIPYSSTSSGTYQIAFNTTDTAPAIALPTANVIPLTNAWADGTLLANGEQWFKFTATATTQYIHFKTGTLTGVYVQLYDINGIATGARASMTYNTYTSRSSLTIGSEYYVRVIPYSSTGSGAYQIGFTSSTSVPITVPATIPTLTVNTWADGNMGSSSSSEQWFQFTATAASQYIHFYPGTSTSVYVQLYDSTFAETPTRTNLTNTTTNTARTLTEGSGYYIRVTYNYSSGAYQIGFTTSTTSPAITLPSAENVTTLTLNTFANGNISTAGGEQWFKFTATAATQYIHFNPGTLASVYVQLYTATGTTAGSRSNMNNATINISQTSLTSSSDYYIRITPYSSTGSGAYKIGFNTGTTPPPITTTPPASGVTQLTVDTWANGNITTSGGEEWFKFTATATTQYIHFIPGTLTNVYIQLYDDTNTTTGLRGSLSYSTTNTSRTLSSGTTYHIRVTPYNSTDNGAYQIAFATSSTAPSITLPNTDVTELTSADTWVDGNIPTSGGVQWFKFTATAATQYIHFEKGTLTDVYVQLYNNSGVTTGGISNLFGTSGSSSLNLSASRSSLTSGSTYYIKVWSSNIDNGTYQIAFNTSTAVPIHTDATALTLDVWANGNIPTSSGVQWFKFTATAATQYIHFQNGTGTNRLTSVYVRLYDANGTIVGDNYSYLYNNSYTSRTLTNGGVYYIRVWPYNSTYSGTYNIGFTTSTTRPQ
jgi:hypothetical protein